MPRGGQNGSCDTRNADIVDAYRVSHKQNLFPCQSRILTAIQPSIRSRHAGVAHGRRKHHIWIERIEFNATDNAGILKACGHPSISAILRLENPSPNPRVTTDLWITCTNVHDFWCQGMKSHGSHSQVLKFIGDGCPRHPMVDGAPKSPCRCTGIQPRQQRIVALVNRIDATTQIQWPVLCPRAFNHPLLLLLTVKTRLSFSFVRLLGVPSRIGITPLPLLPKVGRELALRRQRLRHNVLLHKQSHTHQERQTHQNKPRSSSHDAKVNGTSNAQNKSETSDCFGAKNPNQRNRPRAFRNTNEKPDALSYIGLEVAGAGLEPATFGL